MSLTSAVRTADVAIRIGKNRAIGGTVVDGAGEPVVDLRVRLLIRSLASGRQQFAFTNPAAITDDRGIYRFSNLPAADYLVLVVAGDVREGQYLQRRSGIALST